MKVLVHIPVLLCVAAPHAVCQDVPFMDPGDVAWRVTDVRPIASVAIPRTPANPATTLTPKEGFKFLQVSCRTTDGGKLAGRSILVNPPDFALRNAGMARYRAIAGRLGLGPEDAPSTWGWTTDGQTHFAVLLEAPHNVEWLCLFFAVPGGFEVQAQHSLQMARSVPLITEPPAQQGAAQ